MRCENQPATDEAPDEPPEHVLLSSSDRGWSGVDAAEIHHPQDDFGTPAIPRHVLVVNLGNPFDLKETIRAREGYLGFGGTIVLPAGSPREWHLERRGEVRNLHFYLDPALVQGVSAGAELGPEKAELVEVLSVREPQIEHAAISLLSELRFDEMATRIYAESLASVLVYAREMSEPGDSGLALVILTAVCGIGQILGPVIAAPGGYRGRVQVRSRRCLRGGCPGRSADAGRRTRRCDQHCIRKGVRS